MKLLAAIMLFCLMLLLLCLMPVAGWAGDNVSPPVHGTKKALLEGVLAGLAWDMLILCAVTGLKMVL